MPVFEMLEQNGLEVFLLNARQTKNLPGRKSDVQECQWLLKLHAFGLLNNSFQPTQVGGLCEVHQALFTSPALRQLFYLSGVYLRLLANKACSTSGNEKGNPKSHGGDRLLDA
jgi:hypothetical protein